MTARRGPSPTSAPAPDQGTAAMHRCPKCMHPVAPGPGVPLERCGAFTAGHGADCNECGTAFPPGTRMLAGGSGQSDNPHVSLRSRWIVAVLAGVPLLIVMVGLGWFALRLMQSLGPTGGAVVGALVTLVLAALCSWALYRTALVPIMSAVRGESMLARSTWLVGPDRFDRWKPAFPGSMSQDAGGRLVAVSVRAWTQAAGTADARLMVALHAADRASVDALGAHAGTVPVMLRGLQGERPTFVSAGRGVQLPHPLAAVPVNPLHLPRTIEPPALRMRLVPGEPGLEDAAAAARTIAFACMGADRSAGNAAGEPLVGTKWPSRGRAWRSLARIALPIATAAAVIGTVASFLAGCAMMWNGGGAGTFMLVLLSPLVGAAAIVRLSARRTPIVGADAASTWEAPGGSLVAVDSDPDRNRAIALAVSASALRTIEPVLSARSAGDGESTVTFSAGGVALGSITVRQPAGDALTAARRLVGGTRDSIAGAGDPPPGAPPGTPP